jgi:DNA-directed RNA polymerase beta subunit
LKPSIKEASYIQNQEMALLYMSNYLLRFPEIGNEITQEEKGKQNYVLNILKNELLPHVGTMFIKKAWYLGYMVRKQLFVKKGITKHDDRDSFINKRLVTTGMLLEELIRNNLTKFVKELIKETEKEMRSGNIDEIYKVLKSKISTTKNTISSSIRYSLSTGNWGLQKQISTNKKGIAQPLNRLCLSGTLSHLRRVNAPMSEKGGKNIEPRKLHPTQWMRFDPCETPDGHTIGFNKNLAMGIEITNYLDPVKVIERLKSIYFKINLIEEMIPHFMENEVKILINGDIYGTTPEPQKIFYILKKMKQQERIGRMSVSWVIEEQEIRIHTEEGRIIRPLFVVENNKLLITQNDYKENKSWEQLCREGKIEYLDVQEEDTSLIATYYEDLLKNNTKNNTYLRYTHCEIDLTLMFGVVLASIPFLSNNPANRLMFQASQKKQAVSIYATNYKDRMDSSGHILRYPQLQLVTTRMSRYLFENKLPSGQNVIVAIQCYTGYNQEDSLIMNKSSIERGLFTSFYYKTYKDTEKKNQASLEVEKFCKPVKFNQNGTLRTIGTKMGSYDLLDERGFVKVGSYVKEGDVIIGKVIPIKNVVDNGPKFRDASITIDKNSGGVVDWVYVNTDSEGYKFAKVRIRTLRYPGIGDKFCLTPDHDVLTSNGWLNIKNLTKNHKVATLHDGKYIKYENPSETYCFDFEEKMFEINDNNISLCVTPNHKMYCKKDSKYGLYYARDVSNDIVTYKKDFIFNSKKPKCLQHLDNVKKEFDKLNIKDSYSHKSKTIIDNLQIIALHSGKTGNISIENNKYKFTFDNGEKKVDNKKGKWIDYEGKVYCCSVSTGIFYVRRNGCSVWTGNSSRYGQKGTIGKFYNQEDMPYNAEGITPDIIMTPFAIPSRRTIGQLSEMEVGKFSAIQGIEAECPTFSSNKEKIPQILEDALKSVGFESKGTEILYNPKNGERIKTRIFTGISYYQRLKHMVKDKIHARSTGPLQQMTRQPPEGRKRDGGLKFGEMEKDCMLGYSSVGFLKEKFFNTSDKYVFYTCNKCGQIAVVNPTKKIYKCLGCEDSSDFTQIQAPYSAKLFIQELISMGIMPRIYT